MKKLIFLLYIISIAFFLVKPGVFATDYQFQNPTSYTLPYPGMTLDHPLYIFKKIKQKILEKLYCTDKQKLIFYKREANKEIAAVELLAKKKKYNFALDTARRGVNYITLFLHQFDILLWLEPGDTLGHFSEYESMIITHQEILQKIALQSGNYSDDFQSLASISASHRETLYALRKHRIDKENENKIGSTSSSISN